MIQMGKIQPPSGGCVLKPYLRKSRDPLHSQPPSGGCVLKLPNLGGTNSFRIQPPSGGCVLKLAPATNDLANVQPAAFGRLCVETLAGSAFVFTSFSSRLRAAVC